MAGAPIIETQALTKIYRGQVAVDRLTFTVGEGEVFGFLGPNGAGKTTTLLMLLGLTEPTGGTARVMGLDPAREPIAVKARVGYLPENMGFYPDLDARQMLDYVGQLNGIGRRELAEHIDRALDDVGLAAESRKKIGAFSRGMRQRLGIAELLIKDCRVAFLDEPTLGLDPDATIRIMGLIESLAREKGMTILISSHQLQQIEKVCHRVGIMIRGRMVAAGPMSELAQAKFGLDREEFTLEEIYMRYFLEA
jgi:ABC-2 type transport system ATP-binding protein